ncbi:MAG: hypothetical protein ABIL68_17230 [bacterium]
MVQKDKIQSRREFLKGSLRATVLGGFVFMAAALGKRKKMNAGPPGCLSRQACRTCAKLKNCSQLDVRIEKRKHNNTTNGFISEDEGVDSGQRKE